MAARQHVSIDLDTDVAAILRAHAAEAHLSEGEIVDRAIRAYDLRSLLAQIRERSDLDEDQALALATARHADAIVTGDPDLHAIDTEKLDIEILTPRQLVDRLA